MQTGGGLVQNIDSLAGGLLRKLCGQLHPLGLAAGKLRGGLAQLHVAQAHILQGLQPLFQLGQGREEVQRLVHRHVQHIGNVLALVADL